MTIVESERMIIKTNINISNGTLVSPSESRGEIDIFKLTEHLCEDGGFGCYDKTDQSVKICHIGLESKTFPLELSYGIEKEAKETYEGKKYMQEALRACIAWLFTNANVDQLFACLSKKSPAKDLECDGLRSNNKKSEHILQKLKFKFLKAEETKSEVWYKLTKKDYLESTEEINMMISIL